jgi:hypothetical protein
VSEFVDVEPERRAVVAIDQIGRSQRDWQRSNRRPRSLTARDALIALKFEALFVWVYGGNILNGVEMTDDDRDRLTVALQRIDTIAGEVVD